MKNPMNLLFSISFILLTVLPGNAENTWLDRGHLKQTPILPFGESQTGYNETLTNSLFQSLQAFGDEFIELNIATDMAKLVQNKQKGEYQKAYAQFGKTDIYTIKLRSRGHFRLSNCDFPPLKLNFSKDELNRNGLVAQFDKLKLVTPCGNGPQATKTVMREYLAYKLYNDLTNYSFRVVLVKVNFKDLSGQWEAFSRYGFLIENKHEMAARLNGKVQDVFSLEQDLIASKPANLMAMYQYMIGNEDWSARPLRNLVAMQNSTERNNILIPYDFDFAGLADARYAIPSVDLKHKNVKQRHYFKAFSDANHLSSIREHFLRRESTISATIDQCPLLSDQDRKKLQQYIGEFYYSLKNNLVSL